MGNRYIGIDCGSTTVKTVVLDEQARILFKQYSRHHSQVKQETLRQLAEVDLAGHTCFLCISGSAGLGLAQSAGIEFVQEVYATKIACGAHTPGADVIVELGGEDAKILFLTNGSEERMNGSCAGGTGAFIDQMASLMSISVQEMDTLYFSHQQIYNIASRCGVFAKSDIQPLLNQGASKADIAASIYEAIVSQTVSGLAQGRRIEGKVIFLGGPLTFLPGLRDRFVQSLSLTDAVFPENAEYFVALGAARMSGNQQGMPFDYFLKKLSEAEAQAGFDALPPLFASQDEYAAFCERHHRASMPRAPLETCAGKVYLGIDAGSTTTKLVLIDDQANLLYSHYTPNRGDPVRVVREQLLHIYDLIGDRAYLAGAVTTGYGEELLKSAFHADAGEVETAAHFYAARAFQPEVDFILDIGGQDMKCIRLKHGAIDSILLNEACSSGCGSFIESFAHALGYQTQEFAALGLKAKRCVNLGSRCTVFMNSSVKQAQKEGASVEEISAGLSVSVVKNALYKVIRAHSAAEIGRHIVVQGGTFLNDAILRAFELETGLEVVRPDIAGLMGAYGAALYAKKLGLEQSALLDRAALEAFTHTSKPAECKGCQNKCKLTVNLFSDGKRYISGNRCERALGKLESSLPNAYHFKREQLAALQRGGKGMRIGIPLVLNFYETLPFWHAMLTHMGMDVVISGTSDRRVYAKGQHTIPSDTVCYPAKLAHGHIELLLEQGVDAIFYPCMPYNFDEGLGDNHYNCPVVAGYPELLQANVPGLRKTPLLAPYFAPHRRSTFTRRAVRYFNETLNVPRSVVRSAIDAAYRALAEYREATYAFGDKALAYAREHNLLTVILAGRPYHIDPEISHGIDVLLGSLGCVVVSEDAIRPDFGRGRIHVLNQWTYHARLYEAARYACEHENVELVQLVSFGCGLDAITTDQVKDILEQGNKLYTQIKIDEINNLGAAKIRLRSLLSAVRQRGEKHG